MRSFNWLLSSPPASAASDIGRESASAQVAKQACNVPPQACLQQPVLFTTCRLCGSEGSQRLDCCFVGPNRP